jgi:hypothetical protein
MESCNDNNTHHYYSSSSAYEYLLVLLAKSKGETSTKGVNSINHQTKAISW